MLSEKKYLENPCRYASLPFYKLKTFKMPDHLQVIHEEDFKGDLISEPYFRLMHSMDRLEEAQVPEGYSLETLDLSISENLQALSDMIAQSYDSERLPVGQMEAMIQAETFDRNLWMVVKKILKLLLLPFQNLTQLLKRESWNGFRSYPTISIKAWGP